MPSIFEPFGLVALEAFMMQRPLIATSVGGLQKIIKHNVTGLLVEKNNPDAIVNAVKRLVDDEAFSLQLAKNAREDALANYSHDTMCEQDEQVYKALCVKEGIKDES